MSIEEFGRLRSIIVSVRTANGKVYVTMTHRTSGHSTHGEAPEGHGADAAARAMARKDMIAFLDRLAGPLAAPVSAAQHARG